jgi:ATP-dependent Clp protease ATP-binding subunit ClpA
VLTTNAGAQEMSRPSIGFTQADNTSDGMEAIRRLFTPEFRNRLDATIQFAPLSKQTIERVVEKMLVEVETQLERKGVQLAVNDAARGWLADHGYDPKMGARPMARLIQDQIKRPLAEELLFGKLVEGGQVAVSVAEDGRSLALTCTPLSRPVLPQPADG